MQSNFLKPLRIDDLARQANMSTSTFHSHFRAITAMSPLQYQKNLRRQVARLLMLAENKDAATAAFEVGYESPSQFSREYSRLLGAAFARHKKSALNDCQLSNLDSICYEKIHNYMLTWPTWLV